ncbi:trichohyalin-like [Polistes fuscatus]|uniref:trichohyalin-like n=1 Tax=Polistes fuscatus TaxID=30207 RepID=UPI001CA7CD52|nr:trichohyalin-like [Polistes fuscatus]
MDIYRETINVIKVGEEEAEEFLTEKGVRQGCPLSPTLFNVYMADLEEEMRKGQEGGCRVGNEKVWSVSYADDIVLIADREEELKGMLGRFKKYLERKKMILSETKTKIIVFEKRKGKDRLWKWGDRELEEVEEIRYLGYILQKNGRNERHVEETEIWEWEEDERLESVQRRYMKWTLGLDSNTPNYIVEEECKYEKMRIKALRRALKFEEKIRDSDIKLVKECIRERDRDREREKIGKESKMRVGIIRRERIKESRYMRGMEFKEEVRENILLNMERKFKEERRDKINNSRYNAIYKYIRVEEEPEYLKKDMSTRDRKIIARFRCGNECVSSNYICDQKMVESLPMSSIKQFNAGMSEIGQDR